MRRSRSLRKKRSAAASDIVCLRFNARSSIGGTYAGVKERGAMYIDGRFDRMIEDAAELCEGAKYAAFPEMEKLTR